MLISIVIPCYNVQEYLEECLESVFNQIYTDLEIICIDNKSSDNTFNKLLDFKKRYPSLIVGSELKPGAPAARNKGLSMAKGDWIQFLDADDLLLPEKIQHQVNLLENVRDSVFIAGASIKQKVDGEEKVVHPDSADIFQSLFFTRLGITSSNLWNRHYINKVGGWDESLKSSQEADLMFRLLQVNQNIIFDNRPLTVIRERSFGQISQTNLGAKWKQYFLKRVEFIQWLKIYKKEYFLAKKQIYLDGLFGILKILASEDLELAEELKGKYLGQNYKPGASQEHSTKFYLTMFRLFGFKKAERIKKLLK